MACTYEALKLQEMTILSAERAGWRPRRLSNGVGGPNSMAVEPLRAIQVLF